MAEPYLRFPIRVLDGYLAGVGFVLLNVFTAKTAGSEFDDHIEVLSTNSSSDHGSSFDFLVKFAAA